MIIIKSQKEIDIMKKAGEIVAKTFLEIEKAIEIGVTTIALDKIAESFIIKQGGFPSFKGYNGYPKNICASINDEVVHGIPNTRTLKNGDIVGIDVGVCFEGYHSDCARTFAIGEISGGAKNIIEKTKQSFFEGFANCLEGKRLSDISSAIEKYVVENGYFVVRDLVGHGIGKNLHEEPEVPNFVTKNKGPRLYSGMTLAIEPMVNEGGYEVKWLPNDWTVVTKNGKLSSHFENTVLITNNEPQILTRLY